MRHRDKLVPMVVALPLFLQHIDSTAIGTALPTISASLGIDTLRLNLAITAYLISVAIFLPASGWIAERYGARRVFCVAIAVFTAASALCAISNSLEMLVACRVLQGLGGAMMIPVGRLLLLRNVAPIAMIAAMAWFTVPPAMGRLVGPAIGGAIVTWFSWRWVFLINVPLGLLGIALALWVLDDSVSPEPPGPFDLAGFALMGLGLACVLGALELSGSKLMSSAMAAGLGSFGVACLVAYGLHSRRKASPLIDLGIMRYPAFFASTIGGTPLRLAVGAVPFLLPLMFQLGFGMSPLDSGLLTLGTALGTLGTRTILQGTIDR
ncbi:MAG: transporter, partial [Ramlibacter sp.]|nr:transporter [Ramlibacter sp.]